MLAIPDSLSTQENKGLWRRWRPWLIVSVAVLAILALLTLALVILPPLLVPGGRLGPPVPQAAPGIRLSPSPPQATPTANPVGYADVAKALSDVRSNLVAALGVLAVLTGAVVGFLNFREAQRQNRGQLKLMQQGQINDRFLKAIEQLGQSDADKVDARIGAIYSLEQIARDSPDQLHGPIMECLTAFLREHSRPQPQPDLQRRAVRRIGPETSA
jgi:hypothetical protein